MTRCVAESTAQCVFNGLLSTQLSAAICRNVIATIDVDTVSFTAAVGSFLLLQPKWWANIQE
jgi:hypothetical protein